MKPRLRLTCRGTGLVGTGDVLMLAMLLLAMAGCWKEFDAGLLQAADSVAERDAVTGARTVNFVSEEEEKAQGENACKGILAEAGKNNVAVDKDAALAAKLQEMMGRIAKVSHRSNLPWEIHLLETTECNAFTVGGGKVLVLLSFA